MKLLLFCVNLWLLLLGILMSSAEDELIQCGTGFVFSPAKLTCVSESAGAIKPGGRLINHPVQKKKKCDKGFKYNPTMKLCVSGGSPSSRQVGLPPESELLNRCKYGYHWLSLVKKCVKFKIISSGIAVPHNEKTMKCSRVGYVWVKRLKICAKDMLVSTTTIAPSNSEELDEGGYVCHTGRKWDRLSKKCVGPKLVVTVVGAPKLQPPNNL